MVKCIFISVKSVKNDAFLLKVVLFLGVNPVFWCNFYKYYAFLPDACVGRVLASGGKSLPK